MYILKKSRKKPEGKKKKKRKERERGFVRFPPHSSVFHVLYPDIRERAWIEARFSYNDSLIVSTVMQVLELNTQQSFGVMV